MAPDSERSAAAHQATICVVEGDGLERAALVQLLSHLQYEVRGFESAEALLEALEQSEMRVLVVSLELPGLSALELLRELRDRGRQIPAIVLAAESDVPTAVGAIRAGALDFIQKPVIDRILLRRVSDALEYGGS